MKSHNTERMSALVDGELTGVRRWLAERHVKSCAECTAQVRELNRVRDMLKANPPSAQMSDSEDFFWSKVKRGIDQRGGERVDVPMPSLGLGDWLGQRGFARVTVAVMVIVTIGVIRLIGGRNSGLPVDGNPSRNNFAKVDNVSTPIRDSDVTAFNSVEGDATVIWISGLPWTSDMQEMREEFENLEI